MSDSSGGALSSCRMFRAAVFQEAYEGIRSRRTIGEQICFARSLVGQRIPYVVDDYSGLRYAAALLESLALPALEVSPLEASHPLERSMRLELDCLARLRAGEVAAAVLAACDDALDLGAVLRAIMSSGAAVPLDELLAAVGRSEFTDALVRDLVVLRRRQWEPAELAECLGRRLRETAGGQRREAFFTELMAETQTAGLAEGELVDRVRRHSRRPRLLGPDLRLLVAGAYRGLLPVLHHLLDQEIPEASLWQVVEALSALGGRESAMALERSLLGRVSGAYGKRPPSAPLRELALLCTGHLNAGHLNAGHLNAGHLNAAQPAAEQPAALRHAPGPPGTVLVQTALNANRQEHATAEVGGVLTFMRTLGDALGVMPGWRRVVTVEVVPWGAYHPAAQLHTPGRGCHEILKVPVPALRRGEPRELMAHELAVRRTIRNTLRLRGIIPDIVHVRYTDNLSKGMLHLADTVSARFVVTLTPDPHRDFCDSRGRLQRMNHAEALFFLNKVYLADRLIGRADGLLGIAHGSANVQLMSYFPKLCLSPAIQSRPVRIIPEGVRLGSPEGPAQAGVRPHPPQGGQDPEVILRALTEHPGPYRLEKRYLRLPAILNVGRLAPGKGQHRLVEAWAGSSLRQRCTLILVGGNLQRPGTEDREVLGSIRGVMDRHPDLLGRFCHLGAMENALVRLLEQALAARSAGAASRPPVYLCSSLKEEFGISILEAMSAGFLVLGPRRGGVGTYVEHGVSGFLVDTSSSRSMRAAMEAILDCRAYSNERLKAIAARGRRFVAEHFGIEAIAQRFEGFYRAVLKTASA